MLTQENIIHQWTEDDYPGRAWRQDHRLVCHGINGLGVHWIAYRVHDKDGVQQAWNSVFDDEVAAFQVLGGGRLCTTQIPGLPGDWIITVQPHGD